MNRSVNRVILWALARVARMALPAHVVISRSKRLKALRICKRTLLPALCGWLANAGPAAEFSTEEFTGPFPNWADARRGYGAVGDGKADDTAALQKGLDDLIHHTNSCVLYLPAGTYRLTGTLKTIRQAHTDCQGVAVVGEDPARTVLRWDGTNGGTMFQWDAWYSKISRLTFDGSSRAGTGLLYGPAFSTYNETSDLMFRSGLSRRPPPMTCGAIWPCHRRKADSSGAM